MPLAAPPSLAIVTTTGKGFAVVTCQTIPAGERVAVGRSIATTPERTMTSFQVDWERHVELNAPACLLNHSCEPNTGVVDNRHGGYDFLALRHIAAGEEITWDYDTTNTTASPCHAACAGPRVAVAVPAATGMSSTAQTGNPGTWPPTSNGLEPMLGSPRAPSMPPPQPAT
jgi:hypothetical protein